MSHSLYSPYTKPLKLLVAGTAAAALLIGWAAGVGAQTATEAVTQEQASLPATGTTADLPPLPLGHDDVREVQNQLISLGFDPGPADGEAGPGTMAAAQQYDQSTSKGSCGSKVSICRNQLFAARFISRNSSPASNVLTAG